MRVPEEAAAGKAKVTVSFSDWKEARIAPATFEIALVNVTPEEEAKAEQEQKRAEDQRRAFLLAEEIRMLQEQLKQATDSKKRQEIQERLEQLGKRG